jgi:hypothetical protein
LADDFYFYLLLCRGTAGVESIRAQQVIAVMGAQWGDEGKGKLVDVLGADYDIIARCAGGSNAGNRLLLRLRPDLTTFSIIFLFTNYLIFW